jgi:RNA polymerase sigma-70 factor (ECF subfamily)
MGAAFAASKEERAMVARTKPDRTAFAALYDHYFSRVYNYVRYRVRTADLADDITAEVFELTFQNLATFDPERGPFVAWLFGIARNTVAAHLKAQRRRRWLPLDLFKEHPSTEPPPEQIVLRDEKQTALLSAMARLTDRERDVLACKFAAGLTNRSISRLSGLTEGNVAVIIYRAVRRLRAELMEEK